MYREVHEEGEKVHTMGSRTRDLVATLLVVAVGIPYVGYLVRGDMPFVQDPRGMSATGLILGLVAFFVAAKQVPRRMTAALVVVSVVSLVVGVAALAFAETFVAEALLAVFMGSVLVTWGLAMSGHVLHEASDHRGRLSHA